MTAIRGHPDTAAVDDRYITGYLAPRAARCGRCGKRTRVIIIGRVTLPEGVTLFATMLQDRGARWRDESKCITNIGIGCGCYAKFHRQLVHITG